MVIRPGVVMNSSIDLRVGVSRALSTKLPDAPVFVMFRIEKIHQGVEGVAIRSSGVISGGARSRDNLRLSVKKESGIVKNMR